MALKELSRYGQYIALGTHIAASMMIPVLAGIYADNRWGSSPWGVIIGALVGFGAMISIVLGLAAQTGRNEYMEKRKKSDHG